ncbi:MAG: N-acetyl-gamma-glutamyl-phosphate reductase [Blastocatellia bacterium]
MSQKIRAIVAGATGYSGFELIKLLLRHTKIDLVGAFASRTAETLPLSTVHSHLLGQTNLKCQPYDEKAVAQLAPELIFLGTPNEFSNEVVPGLLETGATVVDLSGAWRLKDATLYPKFYGFESHAPQLLKQAVYGLTEFAYDQLREAKLIANPGCYPTTVQVPLIPLLSAGLIDTTQTIICNSASGVSGAGKAPTSGTHFVEVSDSYKAYNIFKHRHAPEIAQGLGLAFSPDNVIFTPHLLPINRGILSTINVRLQPGVTRNDIHRVWQETFAGKPFVRLFTDAQLPEIKFVANTPFCDIGCAVNEHQAIIISAEDNLLKGAASQALQNANIAFGFDEREGIL